MNRDVIWQHSGLENGDRLTTNLTFEGGRRPRVVEYVEDIPCGIVVNIKWHNPVWKSEEKREYRRVINWASIFCGHVIVRKANGESVRAVQATQKYRIGRDEMLFPMSDKENRSAVQKAG